MGIDNGTVQTVHAMCATFIPRVHGFFGHVASRRNTSTGNGKLQGKKLSALHFKEEQDVANTT